MNLRSAISSISFIFFLALAWTGCKDDAPPDPCAGVTCQNGGSCTDGNCDCPDGFSGNFCEEVDFPYDAGKYDGGMEELGDGTVQAWVEVDGAGNPVAIGATLTEEALNNLPDAGKMLSLQMPEQAANTLFDHIYVVWSLGNPFIEPYNDIPKFEFFFYMVSETERGSVAGNQYESAPMPASLLPPGYENYDGGNGNGFIVFLKGVCFFDSAAPEWNGGEFTHSVVYGSYQRQLTFLGPHISEEYLRSQPDATFDIKQPESVQRPGYYPTKYNIKYDAGKQEYEVKLDAFVERD